MVVNTSAWQIEGILVRGAPDFENQGGCTASNEVPDTGNDGSGLEFEEVSKTTPFASFIPELVNSAGTMFMNKSVVNCSDVISIEIRDLDLAGDLTHAILVVSSENALALFASP